MLNCPTRLASRNCKRGCWQDFASVSAKCPARRKYVLRWATSVLGAVVVYGNYLAIRLSRYRGADPYVTADTKSAQLEKPWIGQDAQSLETPTLDPVGCEVPGYDLPWGIQANDPLCCVNAFTIYLRLVLATILGVRMCHRCPHCAETRDACQDAMGSSAEVMGGIAGRADALLGAVECQKISGALNSHLGLYVQRLHQTRNLKEIAELLRQKLCTSTNSNASWPIFVVKFIQICPLSRRT